MPFEVSRRRTQPSVSKGVHSSTPLSKDTEKLSMSAMVLTEVLEAPTLNWFS